MKHMECSVLSMNNGLMAYWGEIKEAAVYHVHLLVGDRNKRRQNQSFIFDEEKFSELALIDVPRNLKYYSFTDLAPIHLNKTAYYGTTDRGSGSEYYIFVEAEDRAGNIIAQSDRIRGVVEGDSNGPRGLASGVYL